MPQRNAFRHARCGRAFKRCSLVAKFPVSRGTAAEATQNLFDSFTYNSTETFSRGPLVKQGSFDPKREQAVNLQSNLGQRIFSPFERTVNPRPSINWTVIKRAYQAGNISLPGLTRKYRVALSTLQKRCCRERWRDQMQRVCNAVESSAMIEATALGQDLARRGAVFVERCLRDDERFHARLMDELKMAEAGDVQAVRSLIAGWRDLISMSRLNFGLNSDSEARPQQSLVQVQCIGTVSVGTGGALPDGMEADAPLDLPDLDHFFRCEGF